MLLFRGCVISPISPVAAAASTPSHTVYIVHNDWHAAVVLHEQSVPSHIIPEVRDFPNAQFLEFSWGDADYFPDPKAGVWAALRAAFWSRGSVMHIVGLDRGPGAAYKGAKVIEIKRSQSDVMQLVEFLGASFARTDPQTPAAPRPGLFSNSRFYPATGDFSAFRTCNTWIAEALAAGNLPINASGIITTGNLENAIAELTAVDQQN